MSHIPPGVADQATPPADRAGHAASDTVTDTKPAACCGRSLWPAGGPLAHACQLCPHSPTYWRRESS